MPSHSNIYTPTNSRLHSTQCGQTNNINNSLSILRPVNLVPCSRDISQTTSQSMPSQLLTQLNQVGPPIVHLMIRLTEKILDHVLVMNSPSTGCKTLRPQTQKPGPFNNNLRLLRLLPYSLKLCNGVISPSPVNQLVHSKVWEPTIKISSSPYLANTLILLKILNPHKPEFQPMPEIPISTIS